MRSDCTRALAAAGRARAARRRRCVAVVSGTLGVRHERCSRRSRCRRSSAVAVAAWLAHRRLLSPSLAALALFGARGAASRRPASTSRSPPSPSRPRSSPAAQCFRGERVLDSGAVARLRDADEAADHVAAAPHGRGRDVRRRAAACLALGALRRDDARPRARLRRRQRAQPRARRDIDRLMGKRTEQRPVAAGPRAAGARARVRARALGALVRPARERRQRR